MKSVLPVFELYISSLYRLLRGVTDYAKGHDWHLGVINGSRFEVPSHWDGDGILGHLYLRGPLGDFLRGRRDLPAVSFNPANYSDDSPKLKAEARRIAVVMEDHVEIGRVGARYLLSLGHRDFCWYGSVSRSRYEGFASELALAGFKASHISPPDGPPAGYGALFSWLLSELRALPKPCAVFCENDSWAKELLEGALACGFKVPDDLAILGVDNEPLICESSGVALSSIDTRLDRVGYEGAALLDRMMNGSKAPDSPILIPPLPLPVARRSTDLLASANPVVANAVKALRENCDQSLSVSSLAKAACVSESGLRKLFARTLGSSPKRLIQEARLARACKLLKESGLKLSSVASLAGFPDCQSMHAAFAKTLKTTPGRYRLESRGAVEVMRQGRRRGT